MPRAPINRKDFLKLAGGALGLGALSYYLGLRGQPADQPPAADLPDYLDGGSPFPAFPGPYLQKDVQLAAFLFPADLGALTSACSQGLNSARAAPFEYVPLMPFVVVIYADMLVASLDERDRLVGLLPEKEIGFWVLTAAMQKTPLGRVPHHLAWHIPYLLVDSSYAIATGREVYGFNKLAATLNKPDQLQAPRISLDVLGFKTFDPTAIAQTERLLELEPVAPKASAGQWADLTTFQNDFSASLLPLLRRDLGQDVVGFAAGALLQNIPLVFNKQVRHAAQTRKAAYQAIVEARMRISSFGSGGFFNQAHELRLNPLASHPIAQKLGLLQTQRSGLGAWLTADCTLGEGIEYTG